MLPIETPALLSFFGLTILRLGIPVLVVLSLGSLVNRLQATHP